MLPGHAPAATPTHQVMSWLVSFCGEGGLLKIPVAVNGTSPSVKFCALATAGMTLTDCKVRELPQPTAMSEKASKRESRGRGLNCSIAIPPERACDFGMDADTGKLSCLDSVHFLVTQWTGGVLGARE